MQTLVVLLYHYEKSEYSALTRALLSAFFSRMWDFLHMLTANYRYISSSYTFRNLLSVYCTDSFTKELFQLCNFHAPLRHSASFQSSTHQNSFYGALSFSSWLTSSVGANLYLLSRFNQKSGKRIFARVRSSVLKTCLWLLRSLLKEINRFHNSNRYI